MNPVSENLAKIRARMEAAARRSGRPPDPIILLAVTKFQNPERIREAAAAGLKHFGESREQEAKTKVPGFEKLGEWHFIGHLQSNKTRSVAGLFDVVQSVDSLHLAERLSAAAADLGKDLRIYAQVNISGEPQKYGFAPGDAETILSLARLPHLKLEGLMGMAAESEDPESARPAFAALRKLRDQLGGGLKLSMGMSGDFEVAIEEGADLVRIGTELFK
jgi:pyridoxal phosphate enzyme (YggS family)